jgi:hypothetical protein
MAKDPCSHQCGRGAFAPEEVTDFGNRLTRSILVHLCKQTFCERIKLLKLRANFELRVGRDVRWLTNWQRQPFGKLHVNFRGIHQSAGCGLGSTKVKLFWRLPSLCASWDQRWRG